MNKSTMYVCTGIRTKIECLNYEVVVFQPQTEATPDLDLGCSHTLFNPNNEVCMPMTRDDINRVWNI